MCKEDNFRVVAKGGLGDAAPSADRSGWMAAAFSG